MSKYKTLQEIYQTLGITRRAVQGYEEMGLVSASDKNKYGYLLYSEADVQRIKKIKLYQELGFKLKEVKELIDAPDYVVKEALEKRIIKLKEEQERLERMILIAKALIEELEKKTI